MTTLRPRIRLLRCLVTCSTWLVPPSMALAAFAACADSSEADESDAAPVVIPTADSGDEALLDAATADGDTSFVPCGVGSLCSAPSPFTLGFITAINGRTKNDVWASGSRGLLMHYDGQRWTALDFPVDASVNETLSSLFLTPNETWGIAGTLVLRRTLDPSSVRLVRGPEAYYSSGIAVLESGEIYMSIAPRRTVRTTQTPLGALNFDTVRMTYLPYPLAPLSSEPQPVGIRASFLVPGKALWLVGDQSAVIRYPIQPPGDGGDAGPPLDRGRLLPVPSDSALFAAWGQDDHLWAAGANGTIVHFDGTDWHVENTGTTATFRAIFGRSPADVWAAGDNGTVLHFDGNAWSSIGVPGYSGALQAIWGSASDDVWIGGEGGMFHWGALP